MGRVRRYKKYKSCDPFAKQQRSVVSAKEVKNDEPPELWEERTRKVEQRRSSKFTEEESFERMLQREALRDLQKREERRPSEKVSANLEGRKDGESMKQFKKRIRQDTRRALCDELKNLTTTSKKKKKYLIAKKFKKKGIECVDINEELIEEGFSSRNDGHLRPSDLGGEESFAGPEAVAFGTRVDMPPEFRGVDPLKRKNADGTKELLLLSQKKREKVRVTSHSVTAGAQKGSKVTDVVDDTDTARHFHEKLNSSNEDGEPVKKKGKKRKITDIVGDLGGSAEGNHQYQMKDGYLVPAPSKKGARSLSRDHEKLRMEAQEAYKALREKKRKF